MKAPGSPSSPLHTTYFLPLGCLRTLSHFRPAGKPPPPPAPEAGVQNLLTDGLVGHLKQGFFKGRIAVLGQILVNVLGVGGAAVLQHHPVLLVVKGDIAVLGVFYAVQLVEQPIHYRPLQDGFFNNLVAVLQLHMGIENPLRLNLDQGPHLAETVAATLFQIDAVSLGLGDVFHLPLLGQAHVDVQPPAGALRLDIVVQLQRSAGDTAGSGAQ